MKKTNIDNIKETKYNTFSKSIKNLVLIIFLIIFILILIFFLN